MNKWLKIGLIIVLIVIIIVIMFYLLRKQEKPIEEYTPEEEISQEELRKTIVTLYFQNKETKQLQAEPRLIDSKELLKEPYKKLLVLLIEGPKNDLLEGTIPKDTKINSIQLDKDTLIIDLSEEFIKLDLEKTEEANAIYSIVNTLTELKEVTSIKILIDGEENKKIENGNISFNNEFVRVN